jgi:hypothetical protein
VSATFTFAFVAAYLTLGAVVALLLGRMVALRDRQVPPDLDPDMDAWLRELTGDDDAPEQARRLIGPGDS